MPLIDIRWAQPAPDGLCELLRTELAAGMGVERDKAWVSWQSDLQRVPERGPELLLRCRHSHSPDRVAATLHSLRVVLGRGVGVPAADVFAQAIRVDDGDIVEQGARALAVTLHPIGFVRSSRTRAIDDYWGGHESVIELLDDLDPALLEGFSQWSHAEVIFHFDQVPQHKICWSARHPRNRSEWPLTGILAQRGKARPNRLGLSRCRVVQVTGRQLRVLDLDAIDGTPVLDIKPWIAEFGPRGPTRQPAWAAEVMDRYYLDASEDPRDD